jgi:serine/threonine-protein kinase
LIKRELGRGAMGRVSLAWDEKFQKNVALKVMDLGTGDLDELRARERFRREAITAGGLESPNIVVIYDLGTDGDLEYIAMQYLDGDDLKRIITEQRPLSLVRKLDIIAQICDGLHTAHKHKIIHRDVKPANIMVLRESGVAKLVDFGVARIATNPYKSMPFLTPAYSSPEQTRGEDNLDYRSDIFSLGIVLYELVSYQHPFIDRANPKTVEERIRSLRPPPLSSIVRDCPASAFSKLDKIARQALAKDPADRFQTAELMAVELRDLAGSLKRDTIEKLSREAKQQLDKGIFERAEALYKQIIEIEPSHTEARAQLQKIQDQLSTRPRDDSATESLSLANEALQNGRFEEAISEFSRVLRLDPRREEARKGREKAEKGLRVSRFLERAQKFFGEGDFRSAKRELQEVINTDRDYGPALKLLQEVERGLHEQERRRQVSQRLEAARRFVAEKSYSRAIETLARALELDPANPEVEAALRLAREGHEQEERRRQLRKLCTQIQDALYQEQFEEAERLAADARKEFPEDSQVARLYEQATRRNEMQRTRRYAEEQQRAARELIQKGMFDEAVALLKRALETVPNEPVLTTLLKTAQEGQTRAWVENRVRQAQVEASELMRSKNYFTAIEVLEAALADVGNSADLSVLLEVARGNLAEQTQRRQERVRVALDEAQAYAEDHDYEDAVRILEEALPEQKSDEIANLLASIRDRWQTFEHERDATLTRVRGLLQAGNPDAALTLLNDAPEAFARSKVFQQLVAECRRSIDRAGAVRSVLAQVDEQIRNGALDKAEALVEGARSIYSDDPALAAARQRIAEERARLRRTQLQDLLQKARAAVSRMEYEEAISLLSSVAWDAKDPAELKTEGASLLEKARRLESDLSARCAAVEEALSQNDFDHAEGLAKSALVDFPGNARVRRLEADVKRLAEAERNAQEAQARAQAENRVRQVYAEASELMRCKNYAAAIEVLEAALADVGNSPELGALLEVARGNLTEQTQRLQERVRLVLGQAQAYAQVDDYANAVQVLERALEEQKSDEIEKLLTTLRGRWQTFEREREATLTRARGLLQAGNPDAALTILDAAPEAYTRSKEFQQLVAECRRHIDRAGAVRSVLAQVDEQIRNGALEKAEALVEGARSIYSDDPALAAARQRIAEERARLRRTQLQDLLQKARAAVSRMEYEEAISLLSSVAWDAKDPAELKTEGASLLEKARRLESDLSARCAAVEEALSQNDFDHAEGLAKSALVDFPGNARVRRLEADVKRLAEAERNAQEAQARAQAENRVRQVYAEASELMRCKNYAAAIEVLEAALADVGNSPELGALLEVARGNLTEQTQRLQERVRLVLGQAQAYAQVDDYANAVQVLERALEEQKSDEIEKLLTTLRGRWQTFEREREATLTRARGLLQAGNPDAALTILDAAPEAYTRSKEFQQLVAECRRHIDRAGAVRSVLAQVDEQIRNGALEKAEALVEGARSIYSDDPALAAARQRIAEERARLRRTQLQDLLQKARAAVSRMEYEEAISLLSSVAWDAKDPAELKTEGASLLEKARRLESDLSARCAAVEEALSQNDFDHAEGLAKSALVDFPDNERVRRLEANVGRLAEAHRKSSRIDQQLETARSLSQEGRWTEAEAVLRRALETQPDDPRLESLLRTVQESQTTAAIEELLKRAVEEAKEKIRIQDYPAAIARLENALADLGPFSELSVLLDLVRVEQSEQRRRLSRVERVLSRAEEYRQQDDFERAVEELERDRQELQSPEIESLLETIHHEWDEFQRARDVTIESARSLLGVNKPEEALRELDAAPKSYRRSEEFRQLHEDCRIQLERERLDLRDRLQDKTRPARREGPSEVEPPVQVQEQPPGKEGQEHPPQPAPQPPAPPAVWWAAISAVIMIIVVALVIAFRHKPSPPPPPPTVSNDTGYIELNPQPWAEIDSVKTADGKDVDVSVKLPVATPMRLSLPPGDYTISYKTPERVPNKYTFKVTPGQTLVWRDRMGGFDVDKAVDELVK